MSRIIAIDYGKKRCGLAVTDPLQIIATHLDYTETSQLINFLISYCKSESVEGFVIGIPKRLDNTLNEIAKDIELFKEKLKIQFPEQYIEAIDERYTSKIAQQSIIMSVAKKKDRREKGLVDMVSAVILLQDYLKIKEIKK